MSYETVGVINYDSETVRYHLGLFRNINPVKDFTSFNDSELFLSTNWADDFRLTLEQDFVRAIAG
jgi:hypothetical protein